MPEGVTIVPGSASADTGSLAATPVGLFWDGTLSGGTLLMEWFGDPDLFYPFDNYVPLALFFYPLGGNGDEESVDLSGFGSFTYLGEDYSEITMFTNGYAIPGGGGTSEWFNTALPDPTAPNNMIAPFWTDLDMSEGGGGEWYAGILTDGTYDYLILEWEAAEIWGDPTSLRTFQIWFVLDTDFIWFAYGDFIGTDPFGTIGFENETGTAGVTYHYNGAGEPIPEYDEGIDVIGTPGESVTIDFVGKLDGYYDYTLNELELVINEATYEAPEEGYEGAAFAQSLVLNPYPEINFWKSVSLNGTCGYTSPVSTHFGDEVTYCFILDNAGNMSFDIHNLFDDNLGGWIYTGTEKLIPGERVTLTWSTELFEDTYNIAWWLATSENLQDWNDVMPPWIPTWESLPFQCEEGRSAPIFIAYDNFLCEAGEAEVDIWNNLLYFPLQVYFEE
jgi:hypothetical protein